jgi:high-affinity iron transporter
MFATLMVSFREGLEAFLIVSVTLLYLRQTGRSRLIGALRWATVAAAVFSVGLGVVLARIGGLSSLNEAWLASAAFALVLSCTVHMLRHGKQIAGQIRDRLDAADAGHGLAPSVAVFLFVFLMISREGVEAATVLASLASSVALRHLAWGGALGVLLAALLALAWSHYGKRVNLQRFFQVTAIFMVLFSIQLLVYAAHEFTEAGAVPWIDNARWHVLTEPYGPEGNIGAGLSYSLVLVPMIFMLLASLRREPRAAGAATAVCSTSPEQKPQGLQFPVGIR